MGHDVTELPETAYHYTRLQYKKNILQKGLVATDNYNKGDTPVVWFYCVRQEIMTEHGTQSFTQEISRLKN